MPNIRKKFLLHFYVLNSFYMFWAQVVFRMQKYYVSTVRFSALILEILWKIYVTEFLYRRYHGSRCIDICDWINGRASFSAISSSEEAKSCNEYAVRAPPQSSMELNRHSNTFPSEKICFPKMHTCQTFIFRSPWTQEIIHTLTYQDR